MTGKRLPSDGGAGADEPRTCATCGGPVDVKRWHPVATGTDADGEFRVYAFCCQSCRDEWTGE
jgi:hypothetical protein